MAVTTQSCADCHQSDGADVEGNSDGPHPPSPECADPLAGALLAVFTMPAGPSVAVDHPCPTCSRHLVTFLIPVPRLATRGRGVGGDCHEASWSDRDRRSGSYHHDHHGRVRILCVWQLRAVRARLGQQPGAITAGQQSAVPGQSHPGNVTDQPSTGQHREGRAETGAGGSGGLAGQAQRAHERCARRVAGASCT